MSTTVDDPATSQQRSSRPGAEDCWDDDSAVFQRADVGLAAAPESSPRPSAVPRAPASEADEAEPEAASTTESRAPLHDEALAAIFSQYHRYVAKIGRRILGTSADVDDLIQDVFLATVKDIDKIREPEKLRGWLATVATRMARRKRSTSARRESLAPSNPDDLVEMACEAPSPESTADLSGKFQHVLDLPEELRTPWLLRHLEGHTLESVARACDCSMSTAQRRIQAAAGRLARKC